MPRSPVTTGALILLALAAPLAAANRQPVFEIDRSDAADDDRQRGVTQIMAMTEDQMLALVPESGGIFFTECPNCETDAQDYGNFTWTASKPRQLQCRGCDIIYPNEQYPANQTLTVEAPHDGELRFDYYTRPDGFRIFFDARADYFAREFMEKRARQLAESYHLTGDEQHARRAALILLRFAEVYPGYPYIFDYPFKQTIIYPYNNPHIPDMIPYRISHFSWWAHMDISQDLLAVYDLLREYAPLSDMAGGDARRMIERDLLGHMTRWVISIADNYSNMSPGMWRDFINAGNVLDQPDYVLEGLERVERFVETSFHYDGTWCQPTFSYDRQVASALSHVRDALSRYQPPADTDAETAARIRRGAQRVTRTVDQQFETLYNATLPNGMYPPVNDTWAHDRDKHNDFNGAMLLPAMRLAVLRAGDDDEQVYAWLNNTGAGHHHDDPLDIGLFAFGRELLRDIGYTHTGWRMWPNATMSHNTVVVDGIRALTDEPVQRTRLFYTDGHAFHIAQADDDGAYPATRRYRRTVALVGDQATGAYLIDVFEVRGGSQHDYLLHGSAAEDSTAVVAGATLSPFAGTLMNKGVTFELPSSEQERGSPGEPYGFVRELRSGAVESDVTWDMRLDAEPTIGVRTHLVRPTDATVYTGIAPRIRQAERRDALLADFMAPFFCLRREGDDLRTTFIAVHEPVSGEPRIESVTASVDGDRVVVHVDDVTFTLTDGSWRFARGGETLQLGGEGNAWSGVVNTFDRTDTGGWFDVADHIDEDASLSALLIALPDDTVRAYNVTRIEPRDGGTRLHVKEDPAMRIADGKIALVSCPQRTIEGEALRYTVYAATRSQ
jgi:hypothetical protein